MKNRKIMYTIIAVVIVIALAYFGFRSKPAAQEINTNSQSSMHTLENGLQYEITKEGTGDAVRSGDVAVVNYTGKLTDGTVFDSNVLPAFGHVAPFEFPVGAGMVIKGWDIGVLGMKVGEHRTLIIPAELAYGARAMGKIPANSTLTFDVELTGIKK